MRGLSAELIKSKLTTKFFGNEVYFYDEIDSTNNEAKKMAEIGVPNGTLIVAHKQLSGRGRRGKSWVSPSGSGIWMSFVLRPDIPVQCASMLTLVCALAVAKTLNDILGDDKTKIKWPNDIIINNKKICGILTEMSADANKVNHVVIGVGINVNTKDIEEDIKDIATSLFLETGREFDRSEIISMFGNYFETYYNTFLKTNDLSRLMQEYNHELINIEKTVKIIDVKKEFIGTAIGINEKGELLVKKEDGSIENIIAGEVSVRGMYGYV